MLHMDHVRFGSKADICSAKPHVRFTPISDRESGFPQTVMSALPPIADMCSAIRHVCFGPKADIGCYSSLRRRGCEMIDLLAVDEPKPKPAKIRAVTEFSQGGPPGALRRACRAAGRWTGQPR